MTNEEGAPYINDPTGWPTDTMTLREMINKLIEATPNMTAKVQDMIARNPHFFEYETDAEGRETVASYKLANLVTACTMDFLGWAFGHPEIGYISRDPGEEDL